MATGTEPRRPRFEKQLARIEELINVVPNGLNIHPSRATVSDKIIISGPIAVHGIAIMSVHEGLEFEAEIAGASAARESSIRCRANNSREFVNASGSC